MSEEVATAVLDNAATATATDTAAATADAPAQAQEPQVTAAAVAAAAAAASAAAAALQDPMRAATTTMSAISGLWGNVWGTVKKTTDIVVENLGKDLEDFRTQIREDATRAMNEAEQQIPAYKRDLGVFVQQLAQATGFEPAPTPGESSAATDAAGSSAAPAASAALEAAVRKAPEDAEAFEEWRKGFELGRETEHIAQILSSDENVRALHTRLVPAEISYKQFWENYFYQQHTVDQEHKQRQAILNRVAADDEEMSWEDEDEEENTKEKKADN